MIGADRRDVSLATPRKLQHLIDQDGCVDYISGLMDSDAANEAYLLALRDLPWRQERIVVYGREYDVPRLSAWLSDTGRSYTYSGIIHEPKPIPAFVQTIKQCIEGTTGLSFNSVLANLYENGSHSVGWHADNEPELGSAVHIASYSLGSNRILRLRHRHLRKRNVSVNLEHNSLLMMYPPLQQYWMHELPKTKRDVGPRVNLSFRHVSAESSSIA